MTREELKSADTRSLISALQYCGRDSYYATYYDEVLDEITKRLNRIKENLSNVRECFISASSGDDFEMAESAREVMEVLNITCYRHKEERKKSKLTKAKEILKLGLEGIKREFVVDSGGNKLFAKEALKMCNDYCEQAEQFLSEVENDRI